VANQFTAVMETVSLFFEIAGVLAIVIGFVAALVQAVRSVLRTHTWGPAYEQIRSTFGRSVLLGLEILVAADLIRTIAVEPTLDNLYVLGLLVVIRTFLSWSLDVELEGRWPWQRAKI
jgi:uncharacterized membrane protein